MVNKIEVVDLFKYRCSLKSADGNCNNDTRTRVGLAKKRMLDLVPIWRDRGIKKELKMELIVHSVVWTVLVYCTERWTLEKADGKMIESAELWIYRWMLRISWTGITVGPTYLSIQARAEHHQQLLECVMCNKLSFFDHSIRDGGYEQVCDPDRSAWETTV